MEEPIRTKVEPQAEVAPPKPVEYKSEALKTEDITSDIPDSLEVYKEERGVPYSAEYFSAKDLMGDFRTKMLVSNVEKFVNERLETLGWEKTRSNYQEIVSQIEKEIGSNRLDLYKRLEKLTSYINVLRKLKGIEELKKKYAVTSNTSE